MSTSTSVQAGTRLTDNMANPVRITIFCVLATLLLSAPIRAQRETVDRIVAVVGNEVILASELANQIQWTVFQSERQPKDDEELEEWRDDILNQMISDRLFLIAAREDTSVSVRTEEIDQALDDRIDEIAGNFATHEAFLDALAAEDMTLRDLRKKFRDEIQNQILKQRFIQKKLYTVSVSRHEVEEFYRQFGDSIPSQPEAVKLAHLLLAIHPSKSVEDSVRALAERLRESIVNGADFATVSANNSSLGAGADGGDLGWVSRTDVVEEFARSAFMLGVGDVSGVVRTQFGMHIIKCEGKRDDRRKLRHVLLAVQPTAEDTARVVALADSLLTAARAGESFEEMAKIFSADDESRAQGGELGWFAAAQLPPEFGSAVAGWQSPGEYRGPVQTQYGLHLLKLLDYQPEKQYTLADDFDRIKDLARQDKTGRIVDEWIEDLKTETLIDIRLDSLAN